MAILLIVASGWRVGTRADDLDAGLERDDYLSYLIFADILPEAIASYQRARLICFASDLANSNIEMPTDATETLVASLRSKFAETYPDLQFMRRSQCATRYNDDILYLVIVWNDEPEPFAAACTGYEAFYSMGGWSGRIHVYKAPNDDATTVERASCEMAGLIAAP